MSRALSSQIKRLRGNPGRGTLKDPPRGGQVIRAPRGLSAALSKEWHVLVPGMVDAGIPLVAVDAAALEDMARLRLRIRQAEALVDERGLLVPSAREGEGHYVKNPAVQLAKDYRAALQKWYAVFGLSPAARRSIDLVEEPPEDSVTRYLAGATGPAGADGNGGEDHGELRDE